MNTEFWLLMSAAAAKSLQSCPTLWDPIDGSPPSSPVPGILQARTLEWVAISFSNAWKWKVKVKSLSRVRLLATPWTAAHQAPLSMGFARQEYWSGVPLPSPSFPISPQHESVAVTLCYCLCAWPHLSRSFQFIDPTLFSLCVSAPAVSSTPKPFSSCTLANMVSQTDICQSESWKIWISVQF